MKSSSLIPWSWFRRDEAAMPAGRRVFGAPSAPLYMELDRLFDNLFNGYFPTVTAPKGAKELGAAMIRPNLDISGDDKNYFVTVELPGVDADNLHVEVENDTLRISGEKKSAQQNEASQDARETLDQGRSYYRIERSYGSFQRILSLPEDVDGSAISADHKDGVLTITLPRKEVLQPEARKIRINQG